MENGDLVLLVRQATRQGYAVCASGGVFDAAYANSDNRRGRVICKGMIAGTLTASGQTKYVFKEIKTIDQCLQTK